jgi:hypothetical protein
VNLVLVAAEVLVRGSQATLFLRGCLLLPLLLSAGHCADEPAAASP